VTLLQELERRLTGLQLSISNGIVERQDDGRIVALYIAQSPHELIENFAIQKGVYCLQLVALSDSISSDPDKPTIFDCVAQIKFEGGEQLFDIASWSNKTLEYDASMSIRGQCAGYINGGPNFIARHTAEYRVDVETPIGIFTYDLFLSGDTMVNLSNDF
jgi:hypothetical protein